MHMTIFDGLQQFCQQYLDGRDNAKTFVTNVRHMFADDNAMDWCEDQSSLRQFAKAIDEYGRR